MRDSEPMATQRSKFTVSPHHSFIISNRVAASLSYSIKSKNKVRKMTHEKYEYNSKSHMIMDLMKQKELMELLGELIQLDKTGLVDEIIDDLAYELEG